MKARKQIVLATAGAIALVLFANNALAAQGYTIRIAMGNETYAPFTIEKVARNHTNLNEEESTSFDSKIGYAETGSYNFLHNTDYCDGNYKFNVIGKSGIVLGECKVSFSSQKSDQKCQRFWDEAKCENTGTTNIQFHKSDTGAHHRNFTIK
ncbi:hypothetical protein [Elongatibacter sediminis]|uniref:Uncharacterized protein n=1 Tax=Elongatibacter sediminis TaxID=3119006 RepID=A0AAW9R788_9GAMM